jgi:predicted nucleotidyltransferase
MGKTALELSPEEWRAFQPAEAIRRRKMDRKGVTAARRDNAWRAAQHAAELLKNEFGASRVVVFGSLAYEDGFTPWSDLDLAAWGIEPSQFYRAVAAVTGVSSEIKIDLVDPESCKPRLRETIEREGIEL